MSTPLPIAAAANVPAIWRLEGLVLGTGVEQTKATKALEQAMALCAQSKQGHKVVATLRPIHVIDAPEPFIGKAYVVGLDVEAPQGGAHAWQATQEAAWRAVLRKEQPEAMVVFVARRHLEAPVRAPDELAMVSLHLPAAIRRKAEAEHIVLTEAKLRSFGLPGAAWPRAWDMPALATILIQAAMPSLKTEVHAAQVWLNERILRTPQRVGSSIHAPRR